jgi:hypothetical protein
VRSVAGLHSSKVQHRSDARGGKTWDQKTVFEREKKTIKGSMIALSLLLDPLSQFINFRPD